MKKNILVFLFLFIQSVATQAQYSPLWIGQVGDHADEKLYGITPYIMTDIVGAGQYHDKTEHQVYPFITRYSPGGTHLWEKHYKTDVLTLLKTVAVDADGYIYAAGHTKDNPHEPYTDFFLMKVDGKGELVWKKKIPSGGYDEVRSMVFNPIKNKIILAGYQDTKYFNEHHPVIMQVDTAGNKEWTYSYPGSYGEEINKIIRTKDGGYAFAGFEQFNNGGNRMMLIGKINHKGEEEWIQSFEIGSMAIANSITELRDGGFAICGLIREDRELVHDIILMRLAPNGVEVWRKVIREKNDEEATDIILTKKKNHLMILGYSKSRLQGKSDIWLLEYDVTGEKIWDNILTSRTVDFGHQLYENKYGSIVIGGGTYEHNRGNWDGALLYYEETKAPVIKMKTPDHENIMVSKKDFLFHAQLSSKDSVNVVQVIQDNKRIEEEYKVYYKSVEESVYKANIRAKTKLKKGRNLFWVKAMNSYGETTTKVYAVVYNPRPKKDRHKRRSGKRR